MLHAQHDLQMEKLQSNPNSTENSLVGDGHEQQDEVGVKMKNIPLAVAAAPSPVILPPSETRKATINLDKAIEYELKHGRKLDPKMDKKKLRRTVSNRLSAQRSRIKKAQYIHEMERRATELEDTIAVLTIRVNRYLEKKRLLQLQNEALERLVAIRRHEAHVAQMHLDKNQAELGRLKEEEKELLRVISEQDEARRRGIDGFNEDGRASSSHVQVVDEKQGDGKVVGGEVDIYLNFHGSC